MNKRDSEQLDTLRHSAAHVMAAAVKRLFPSVRLGIGPAIEDGFYYDFDIPEAVTPERFEEIEREMEKIIAEDHPFERRELSHQEAVDLFRRLGEDYKLELLEGLKGEKITVYRHGDFVDLCQGPHLERGGQIKAFKLLSLAGAYWKGDEQKPMLQRIYGTAFPDRKSLEGYLKLVEEARKRDHRRLGKELDLFSLHPEAPGSPFFHPRGVVLYQSVVEYWREVHRARGYREIMTPVVLEDSLWHQSGHWDHYKDHMYFVKFGEQGFALKPMNCPGVIIYYKQTQHSYREFPLRIAELGRVHRRELTGVLHGLFRVQSFVIDDAHIFCLPEQIKDEIVEVASLILEIYRTVGFSEYQVEISTRPESFIGSVEDWETATAALAAALREAGIDFQINEGEGAFYGPKIDFHIRDSLKRSYQCGTIQLDFSMPARFNLEYVGPDGARHRPVMIHRAALGSVERFLGILIEHYAGAFPLWLSPVQARILPVSAKALDYASGVKERFVGEGIRVELDDRPEKLNWKIRQAQKEKIPYMLVVGEKEAAAGTVSIRRRSAGESGSAGVDEFISRVKQEIASKAGG